MAAIGTAATGAMKTIAIDICALGLRVGRMSPYAWFHEHGEAALRGAAFLVWCPTRRAVIGIVVQW